MLLKVSAEKVNKDKKVKRKFSVAKFISVLLAGFIILAIWGFAFYYLFDVNGKDSIFGPDQNVLSGKTIVLDAGAGVATSKKLEQPYLGSNLFVDAYTVGVENDKITEEEVNLLVVQKLKSKLEELGVTIYLTRNGKFSNITNVEKAEFANAVGADLLLEVFCNSAINKGASGVSVAVPDEEHTDAEICEKSKDISENILKYLVSKTKTQNLGISHKDEYTEFNWVKVPAVRVVIGYLSNPEESKKLMDTKYQDLVVEGIVDGLARYYLE